MKPSLRDRNFFLDTVEAKYCKNNIPKRMLFYPSFALQQTNLLNNICSSSELFFLHFWPVMHEPVQDTAMNGFNAWTNKQLFLNSVNFPIFGRRARFIVYQLARQYLFMGSLATAINHYLTGAWFSLQISNYEQAVWILSCNYLVKIQFMTDWMEI